MCEKCRELDEQIARYRHLASRINDRQTVEGLQSLIDKAIVAKNPLHPENGGGDPDPA